MLATAASAFFMTSLRSSGSKVRSVPVIVSSSGMMLNRTPPWIVAMVRMVGVRVTFSWRAAIWLKA